MIDLPITSPIYTGNKGIQIVLFFEKSLSYEYSVKVKMLLMIEDFNKICTICIIFGSK